jgi:hypothetical protein
MDSIVKDDRPAQDLLKERIDEMLSSSHSQTFQISEAASSGTGACRHSGTDCRGAFMRSRRTSPSPQDLPGALTWLADADQAGRIIVRQIA